MNVDVIVDLDLDVVVDLNVNLNVNVNVNVNVNDQPFRFRFTSRSRSRSTILAFALVLWAAPAAAQTAVAERPAFSVERFTPAPGRAGFGTVEDPDVLPAWAWAASAWSSLASRPIVLRDVVTGEEATVPVRWRLGFEAGAALGLGARYQIGIAVPWAAQDGDRLQGTGLDARPLDRLVLGDVRLHGRARVAGARGERGVGAALAAALALPTGDDGDFAGEAGAVFEWKLVVGWRSDRIAVAANLGIRIRSREVVLLSPARPHGDELLTGVAATVALRRRIWAIGEAVWAIADSRRGSRGPSPAELRAGVRVGSVGAWSVTALGGLGITPGDVGSPAWRAVLGVSHDRAPIDDRDGDGVIDGRDDCRAEREDRDRFHDADGCPDPDNDGDGLLDELDRCPLDAEDVDGFRDGDGCPDSETWVVPLPTGPVSPPPDWLSGARLAP